MKGKAEGSESTHDGVEAMVCWRNRSCKLYNYEQ